MGPDCSFKIMISIKGRGNGYRRNVAVAIAASEGAINVLTEMFALLRS